MGFASHNFDKIVLPFPSKGMNRDIEPHLMPPDVSWYLENFTQDSFGKGVIRYGVKNLMLMSNIDDGFPMRGFPYVSPQGAEQILMYWSVYKTDAQAYNMSVLKDRIYFETTNLVSKYRENTSIKFSYTNADGQNITIRAPISDLNDPMVGASSFKVKGFYIDTDTPVTQICYSTGEIHLVNVAAKTAQLLVTGLRTDCIPRGVHFIQKLLITNGLDDMRVWDGTALTIVTQLVKERATEIQKLSDNVLKFKCINPAKYGVGRQIFFNATVFTITNVVTNVDVVTLTLSTPVGNVPTQVFFYVNAPKVNFLYVAQDRLWGLGQGAAGIQPRIPAEAMKVYYTDIPNRFDAWTEEQSQSYKMIDLSNKHGSTDNLEAIARLGNRMVFIGREKTQVFIGEVGNNTFSWQSTLSTGAVHGDLVLELANDIFYVNFNGLNSFSTLNIGNQFATLNISAINSILKNQVSGFIQDETDYRSSFSFFYHLGTFIGLKIGDNLVNHALFSNQPYFFSVFSGAFKARHIFSLGNRLFLINKKNVYTYGDGRDGTPKAYNDDGLPIVGSWIQPFNHQKQRVFSCYRVSCLADYNNAFVDDDSNGLYVELYNERPKTVNVRKKSLLQPRKDILKAASPEQDPIVFEGRFKTLTRKLKTRGEGSFAYLSVISNKSFFNISQTILYGRYDR